MSMKLSVLDELKDLMDERMAGRLGKDKPVAAKLDIISAKPEGDADLGGTDLDAGDENGAESPLEEKSEGLSGEMKEEGCDMSKLTPEEQAQLEQLYEKMKA